MPIDLKRTEENFATSTDLTVGLEEEFAILDAGSLDLVPRFEDLREAAELEPGLQDAITGELISSEIEIVSGRGEDLQHAQRNQRDRRRRLFALAAQRGLLLGSTGTHPWADYREQPNIDTDHYRRVVEGLGYVARRNNTFSLHVHVGVHDADRAVRVCDRLRPVLPLLLAFSASSPFLEGQDTRLHSVRSQTFTKSFPRCGVPDAFGSWAALPRLHPAAHRHGLDRRVHAGLVVGAPARLVRHGRGEDRRRADHGGGVRCAGRTDRRLRRPGVARHRRGRAVRGSPASPHRGEHVARDPPRDGRQHDRLRRAARRSARAPHSSSSGRGARRCATSCASRPPRPAQRRPAPAGGAATPGRTCARSTLRACARPRRPTPRRFPHEHRPRSPEPRRPLTTRSCARLTRPSSPGSASTTS